VRLFLIVILLAGIGLAGWVFVDTFALTQVIQAAPQVIGGLAIVAALLIGSGIIKRVLAPFLVAVVILLAALMLGIAVRADIAQLAPTGGQQPLATVSTQLTLVSFTLDGAPEDTSPLTTWLREKRPDIVILRGGEGPQVASVLEMSDLFTFVAPFPAESVGPADIPPVMVMSRLPIDGVEVLEPSDNSAAVVTTAIELGGATLAVYAVATEAGGGMAGQARREQQLRSLVPGLRRDTRPVVLAGGLNFAPWMRVIRDVANQADLAMVGDAKSIIMGGTSPGFLPPPAALSVDPILTGHGARILEFRSGPHFGGDRRPVLARMEIAASRAQ